MKYTKDFLYSAYIHKVSSNLFLNPYFSREQRNCSFAEVIKALPVHKIVNIGSGGERYLSTQLLSSHQLIDLDVCGDADVIQDLNLCPDLPFASNEFTLSLCLDVLEHIETFHSVFDELVRISSRYILISLPNSAQEYYRLYNLFGSTSSSLDPFQSGVTSKYYGLPLVPPQDRHRWFLTSLDIIRFCIHKEDQYNLNLKFLEIKSTNPIHRIIYRLNRRLFLNISQSTIIALFDKG